MKASHNLNVQGLQRVAGRLNEEDTSMDTVVNDVHAIDLVLSIEVSIISTLDIVNNRAPRLVIVNEVTESRGVDDSQAKADTRLLDIGTNSLNLDSLGNNIQARTFALSWRIQRGVEESIDESRLAKAGFTFDIGG